MIGQGTKIIPVYVPRTAASRRPRSVTVVDGWTQEGPETYGPLTAPRAYPAADLNHR
jgi:hypothetical protein